MSLFVPARRPSLELLDQPGLSSEEMGRSLEDLELVNHVWGNARVLEEHLALSLKGCSDSRWTILDLGAGSGGVARELAGRLRRRGISVLVVAVDTQWRHLAAGRGRGHGVVAVTADAFALPFAAASADWLVSTLFFHHFSPEENVRLLAEMTRVARRGFALLDIRRHLFPLLAVSIAGRIAFKSPVSVADGIASVRQAYTAEEAGRIAARVGPGVTVETVFPFRILVHRR